MKRRRSYLPPLSWLIVLLPLVGAFFFTPLAFGGVTRETMGILDLLLAAGGCMWLGLLLFQRRLPTISTACLASLLVLVAMGASYLLNPVSVHREADWKFTLLKDSVSWLPGSVDFATSLPVILNLGALLIGGLVLQDAMTSSKTRWFLFRVVAIAGFIIAVIGIIQKADGHESMLWVTPERSGDVFFAAFRYHANAASFLNLSWPAAFAVWMRSRSLDPSGIVASLDFSVFFFLMAAVFVNTSKAGHVLGLVGLALIAWRFRAELKPSNLSLPVSLILAFVVLAMVAIMLLPTVSSSVVKWSELAGTGGSFQGRLLAYPACLRALPESGIFGTGPGTFRLVFPAYSEYLGSRIFGFWYHAHQDWLQGLLEWGYVGFAAWMVLFAGAFFRLGKRIVEARRKEQMEISDSISMIALGVVLVHAMADFPLQIPAIQLLVVFYLAVAWGGNSKRLHTEAQKNPQDAGLNPG